MKKTTVTLFLFLCVLILQAQDARKMIEEGVKLHDEGKYMEAIAKYDAAIAMDPENYLAHYEKSYSLMEAGEYTKSIDLSKLIIKKFPDGPDNPSVYINYGTCYDYLKNPEKAIGIYNEGIKKYPTTSLLYFNKTITLYNTGKTEEAMEAIEKSIHYNPYHASSHNVMALLTQDNRGYSLLASLYFLAAEPLGERAAVRLKSAESLIGANVEKKDDKTINITMGMPDKSKDGQPNNFQSIELVMSMSAALNFSDKYKDETNVERMKRNLETIFAVLFENMESDAKKKTKDKTSGFGWEFYVPFFADLKQKNYLDTYCHIIYASSGDGANNEWLKANAVKIEEFMTWFKDYWKTEEISK